VVWAQIISGGTRKSLSTLDGTLSNRKRILDLYLRVLRIDFIGGKNRR
jgi:hypothetical protein